MMSSQKAREMSPAWLWLMPPAYHQNMLAGGHKRSSVVLSKVRHCQIVHRGKYFSSENQTFQVWRWQWPHLNAMTPTRSQMGAVLVPAPLLMTQHCLPMFWPMMTLTGHQQLGQINLLNIILIQNLTVMKLFQSFRSGPNWSHYISFNLRLKFRLTRLNILGGDSSTTTYR